MNQKIVTKKVVLISLAATVASQGALANVGYYISGGTTAVGAASVAISPPLGLSTIQTGAVVALFATLYDVSVNGKDSLPVLSSELAFYENLVNQTVQNAKGSSQNTQAASQATSGGSSSGTTRKKGEDEKQPAPTPVELRNQIKLAQADARSTLKGEEVSPDLDQTVEMLYSAARVANYAPIQQMSREELINEIAFVDLSKI